QQAPTPPSIEETRVTTETPAARIEQAIFTEIARQEAELNCRVGYSLLFPDRDLHVAQHGDVLFHPASTMKVPIMIEVMRQAEQGLFSLDDTLVVTTEFERFIDGSPFTTG